MSTRSGTELDASSHAPILTREFQSQPSGWSVATNMLCTIRELADAAKSGDRTALSALDSEVRHLISLTYERMVALARKNLSKQSALQYASVDRVTGEHIKDLVGDVMAKQSIQTLIEQGKMTTRDELSRYVWTAVKNHRSDLIRRMNCVRRGVVDSFDSEPTTEPIGAFGLEVDAVIDAIGEEEQSVLDNYLPVVLWGTPSKVRSEELSVTPRAITKQLAASHARIKARLGHD